MSRDGPFRGEPNDTRERIMRATYVALKKYGYADLSLQRIADESGLSKSSVYHFYDDKDDLLVAFLEFMMTRFREEFDVPPTGDPTKDLLTYVAFAAAGSPPPWETETVDPPVSGPFVELRAQAVNDDVFREKFAEHDAVFAERLARVVERGIDQGVFRDVDPEGTAEWLLTFLMGAMFRRTTTEDLDTERLVAAAEAVVRAYLLEE